MTKELAFKDEMPIFRELEYYSRISKMTPEEYQEYQANLKRERDNYAVMQGAEVIGYNRGKAEGRAEGIEEGDARGEARANLKNAKGMKLKGYDLNDIVEITGLTLEEIQNL